MTHLSFSAEVPRPFLLSRRGPSFIFSKNFATLGWLFRKTDYTNCEPIRASPSFRSPRRSPCMSATRRPSFTWLSGGMCYWRSSGFRNRLKKHCILSVVWNSAFLPLRRSLTQLIAPLRSKFPAAEKISAWSSRSLKPTDRQQFESADHFAIHDDHWDLHSWQSTQKLVDEACSDMAGFPLSMRYEFCVEKSLLLIFPSSHRSWAYSRSNHSGDCGNNCLFFSRDWRERVVKRKITGWNVKQDFSSQTAPYEYLIT